MTYLASVQNLKATLVKAYLSALACLHRLKGFPNHGMKDDVMKAVMRGAENLQMVAPLGKQNNRRVMTGRCPCCVTWAIGWHSRAGRRKQSKQNGRQA